MCVFMCSRVCVCVCFHNLLWCVVYLVLRAAGPRADHGVFVCMSVFLLLCACVCVGTRVYACVCFCILFVYFILVCSRI
jgi:hypothetical protein